MQAVLRTFDLATSVAWGVCGVMTFTQKELYKPEKFMINVGLQVRLLCTPASHTYASSHSSIYHQARCVARVRRDATTAVQSADSLTLIVCVSLRSSGLSAAYFYQASTRMPKP